MTAIGLNILFIAIVLPYFRITRRALTNNLPVIIEKSRRHRRWQRNRPTTWQKCKIDSSAELGFHLSFSYSLILSLWPLAALIGLIIFAGYADENFMRGSLVAKLMVMPCLILSNLALLAHLLILVSHRSIRFFNLIKLTTLSEEKIDQLLNKTAS